MDALERVGDVLGVVFGGVGRAIERGVTSLFGSSNARYLKRLRARVDAISALEPKYQAMSDGELRQQTDVLRRRLAAGETLDDILVEAFAICREGGRRYLNMRHFDVQLLGGMVLHAGNIAEMVTGEGKTLVATLPAYLNALEGKGVHVVTVNPYLARRDMEWMGPLYIGLGLTVGAIYPDMDPAERQRAYECDITYGTNSEFGFDYLRDNMKQAIKGDDKYPPSQQQVQRALNFAIVDEVDNILIDEARTPLIISGPAHDDVTRYARADKIARQLKKDLHFEVKEKEHTVSLTEEGTREAERLAGVESFYTAGNMDWPHLIDNSLKAHHLYKLDVNYVVNQGEVIIVDEFTGRLMPGRQWSDGLHQAVEAKEGVTVKQESQTYATITLQNFFKLYKKISGMTGTAMTEAAEFWKIYKLDVVAIPTNRVLTRTNYQDVIYRTEREKFQAIVDEIERLHKWDTLEVADGQTLVGTIHREDDESIELQPHDSKERQTIARGRVQQIHRRGRPVLVGTVSIEKSERLSTMLDRTGVKHEVLNAKHHQREAEIIAQAGRKQAVTIATNMAGRGTDIILGGNPEAMAWAVLQTKYKTRLDVPQDEWHKLVKEIEDRERMKPEGAEVKTLGGLHVIGTERHEARRIDLQLRGRCGRQGDPGSSRFFLSLEDDLMRIFAGEWVKNILTRLGMQEGEAIESRMVTNRIEGAQKKVEERNFEARKSLLEYDEVMDEQRKRVYGFRQEILSGLNCKAKILDMMEREIDRFLAEFLSKDYGTSTFAKWAGSQLNVELRARDYRGADYATAERIALDEAERMAEVQVHDAIEENVPADAEEEDCNWEAVTKLANTRWRANLRERDLRSLPRHEISDVLLEAARRTIRETDLKEGARFLEQDFGIRAACGWVKHKFGIDIPPDELNGLDAAAVQKMVLDRARQAYDEKEVEYPVLAGLYHFTRRDAQGHKRYDRDQLVAWARERFQIELAVDDLRNLERNEVVGVLLNKSRQHQEKANAVLADVKKEVETIFHDGDAHGTLKMAVGANGALDRFSSVLESKLDYKVDVDELAELDRDALERKITTAVEDRYRPEIRRMERLLVLQILDTAWKDHLLAMDHLRHSVGLRGYAQVDPKVEYKREGMRQFEQMWINVAERVTDLVFRMELLNEDFVSSTWVGSTAVHESPPSSTAMSQAQQDQQRAAEGGGTAEKREPIRNMQEQVGRNDPCPCGSGKKFKNCHMRRGGATV